MKKDLQGYLIIFFNMKMLLQLLVIQIQTLLSLLDSRKFSDIKFSNAIYYLLKEAKFFNAIWLFFFSKSSKILYFQRPKIDKKVTSFNFYFP